MSTRSDEIPHTVVDEHGESIRETVGNGGAKSKLDGDEGKGQRVKSMTEKGLDYKIEMHWKKYNAAKVAWENEVKSLENSIKVSENIPELLKFKNSENLKFQEIKQQGSVIADLDTNSVAHISDEIGRINDAHSKIAQLIDERITYLGSDSKSVQSRLSRSYASKTAKSGQRSNVSKNTAIELLEKERKLIGERMQVVKEKEVGFNQIIKEKEDLLRREENLLEREKSLLSKSVIDDEEMSELVADMPNLGEGNVAVNKDLHMEKFLKCCDENVNKETNPKTHEQPHPSQQLNPDAASFRQVQPSIHDTSLDSSNINLEVMKEVITCLNRNDLPRPEPEIFRGEEDIIKFPTWIKSFEIFIESRISDPAERMFYLGKYTAGDARRAIEGLLWKHNENTFTEAKKVLHERYGNEFILANEVRKKLNSWPNIPKHDPKALLAFSDYMKNCLSLKDNSEFLNVLDDPLEMQKLLPKLYNWPYLISKWNNKVAEFAPSCPKFSNFCAFLDKESQLANHPLFSVNAVMNIGRGGASKSPKATGAAKPLVVHSIGADSKAKSGGDKAKSGTKRPCLHCNGEHMLDKCEIFRKLPTEEKKSLIDKNKYCRGCMRKGHKIKICEDRKICTVCKYRHPTCLHEMVLEAREIARKREESETKGEEPEAPKTKEEKEKETTTVFTGRIAAKRKGNSQGLIVPTWISHKSNPTKKVLVYALLDVWSDACFILPSLLEELGVEGPQVKLEIATVLSEAVVDCTKVNGLAIQGVYEDRAIDLPYVYSRDSIPVKPDHIPRRETANEWAHLNPIANQLMPYDSTVKVGVIVGRSCAKAIMPTEILPGQEDEPYAMKTALGWGIIGSQMDDDDCLSIHRIATRESEIKDEINQACFIFETKTKEVINPRHIKEMFEIEFNDRDNDDVMISQNDRLFMKRMEQTMYLEEEQRYEVPLPFKDENSKITNNRGLAENRLKGLIKRFKKDEAHYKRYCDCVNKMINLGFLELVPQEELKRDDGLVWYIPHHGVYHPRKPNKLRVVCDCSASSKNFESLNSLLLQGPDLNNSLVGVMCRFRMENIAFVCDVVAMYHQVQIPEYHRDLMRFLWYKDGNVNNEIIEYRMAVLPFGATPSASIANFILKKTADDFEEVYGTSAADFVRRDFYVDNGMKSVPSTAEALQLIEQGKSLCKRGGFVLHDILSNDKEVLKSVSTEEMVDSVKSIDLNQDCLPIERTLGVEWCAESDSFQFRVNLSSKPTTRRGILSTVSSIFDPLGLISPIILQGKQILQRLCKGGTNWDDPVPDEERMRWEQWIEDLKGLEHIKINRSYKPSHMGQITSVELHHFSDASETGYGQCSYLRLEDDQGNIHCTLLMAKSRVTPLKALTIVRLELNAAVVSIRISSILNRELTYKDITEFFWTDSKVVLGYINNDAKKFHVFVANRVQQIRNNTETSQWSYVSSAQNPADIASRGMRAEELGRCELWWRGPEFLWTASRQPEQEESFKLEEGDPEVRKVSAFATNTHESSPKSPLLQRLNRFSDWFKATRAIAVLRKFVKNWKAKRGNKLDQIVETITRNEIREAEIEIIKQTQQEHFAEEIKTLKNRKKADKESSKSEKKVTRNSKLLKLDCFMDKDEVLRVGGRINRADLDENEKHPIVLPKRSHVTEMIVCHFHKKIQHQGRGITLNEIRSQGYWIIGGSTIISRHIFNCITCRKIRGSTQIQKMADLPEDRVEPCEPFTFSAVDFFGPFLIKQGRTERKRYGVLFTCMASRAVHLEVAHELTTDSFLNAYRRFSCRRGPIAQLRSDRGTNFVGAKNELALALKQLDTNRIKDQLLQDQCDWVNFEMNVPNASHMGGVWERQIRSVRNVLAVLLDQHGQQLDDEALSTFMVEAENIVNSRPLSVDNLSSPDHLIPITPNMLITHKSKVLLQPPGRFDPPDVYSRKRWRRVQYLANEFWTRWRKEFLQTLQPRKKWNNNVNNLKVNDIVLVKDENLARNEWRMGKITEANTDKDGFVRKVKIQLADKDLDKRGKRLKDHVFLERPVHKLILLVNSE